MNVVLVYNPRSGSACSIDELRQKFARHAIKIQKVIQLSNSLVKDLEPYVRSGSTVCVVGGDGTMSAVAACLAGSRAVLMPLPGGTLNHFTKDLGVPQDIDDAVAVLKHSKVHEIDSARVNDKTFINNSSLGLYPSSLRTRARFEDHLGKWPAAVIASVRALLRFRTYKVTINHKTFYTPFIFVGNNTYVLEAASVTRTRLDEGKLSVFIAKTTSRWTLAKILLYALIGHAHTLDDFEIYQATSLTVHTKKAALSIARDGEVERMQAPLRYTINSKALRVRY